MVKIYIFSKYFCSISKPFQATGINDGFLCKLYCSIDICGTELSKKINLLKFTQKK